MQTRPQIQDHAPRGKGTEILVALAVASVLFFAGILMASDSPAASEAQVKAIFLFNFAKYVDWPPGALAGTATPITIGLLGTDPFGDDLQHDDEGKTINGHPFIINIWLRTLN